MILCVSRAVFRGSDGWLALSIGAACDRLNDVLNVLQGQLTDAAAMQKKQAALTPSTRWELDHKGRANGVKGDSHAEALGYPSAREFLSEVMLDDHIQPQRIPKPQADPFERQGALVTCYITNHADAHRLLADPHREPTQLCPRSTSTPSSGPIQARDT